MINLCKLIDSIGDNSLLNEKIRQSNYVDKCSSWVPVGAQHHGGSRYHWDQQESRWLPNEEKPQSRNHVPEIRHPYSLFLIPQSLPQASIRCRIKIILIRRGSIDRRHDLSLVPEHFSKGLINDWEATVGRRKGRVEVQWTCSQHKHVNSQPVGSKILDHSH